MIYSRIAGTGSFLPEHVVTNADLEKIVDTSDQWIRERSGIRERRKAGPDMTTCNMAEPAARRAIEAAGLEPGDIDLLIFGTTTPDLIFPSSGVLLQNRLGMGSAGAMDVNAACSGFLYALSIADKFIRTGDAQRVLVVGAEKLTAMVDWSDRGTCVLFGDGAGAVVIEASEEAGILSTHIHSDGQYRDLLCTRVGVAKGFEDRENGGVKIEMKGNEVFKLAVRTLRRIVDETLEANDLDKGDIDWLIPHQANLRIINATARQLDMSMDKVIVTVDRHGNTSAASVPLALDEAIRDGRVKRGETVLLEAFGGGFTWASALLRY